MRGKGDCLLYRCCLFTHTHTDTHKRTHTLSNRLFYLPPVLSPFLSYPAAGVQEGHCPLRQFSCQLRGDWWIRGSAAAGSLRGPVWGTGSIKHQASRTNGHTLEAKREGWSELCARLHRWICQVDGLSTQRRRGNWDAEADRDLEMENTGANRGEKERNEKNLKSRKVKKAGRMLNKWHNGSKYSSSANKE